MKNKAKCKLCGDILESLHSQDYQLCRCGEIFVDGGNAMYCGAKDWANFLRIDDDDNEIIPKVIEKNSESSQNNQSVVTPSPLSKNDMLAQLKSMIDCYAELPAAAMNVPITHYDMSIALKLIYEIVRNP